MENKGSWLDLDRGDGTTTRQMLGLTPTLGVIYKDGNGESFEGVNWDSVAFDFKTGILSFEIANRCYFVPEVRFYTRDN
jgi:hypothetical protein